MTKRLIRYLVVSIVDSVFAIAQARPVLQEAIRRNGVASEVVEATASKGGISPAI